MRIKDMGEPRGHLLDRWAWTVGLERKVGIFGIKESDKALQKRAGKRAMEILDHHAVYIKEGEW